MIQSLTIYLRKEFIYLFIIIYLFIYLLSFIYLFIYLFIYFGDGVSPEKMTGSCIIARGA
jgi:hypothetical protein